MGAMSQMMMRPLIQTKGLTAVGMVVAAEAVAEVAEVVADVFDDLQGQYKYRLTACI
jgi:hypothetical protein